jgi:outer membrane usher protein
MRSNTNCPGQPRATRAEGTDVVVGWDGLVYLENLEEQNSSRVTLVDGRTCQVQFALEMQQDQVPLIGPLLCQ